MKLTRWSLRTGKRRWERSCPEAVRSRFTLGYRTKAYLSSDNNEDDDHVYMMFSATFPKEARRLAKEYMADDHIRIRVGRAGSTHLNVAQTVR